jgi:DNA adenine methylase
MSSFKTPLRYPGGKQKLTSFIREVLAENFIDEHYVEPYAGGAGVGIELLINRNVKCIHLNDSNLGIYAFWFSVLNHTEELCRLISCASLNVEEWKKQKEIFKRADPNNLLEMGFSVFYMNRCNRSGVLTAGVIGGNDQTGNYKMDARFNRNDLIRRIELIGNFNKQIYISNYDAEYYISNYLPNLSENCLVYFDPPYFNKGSELYSNSYKKSDHARLSNVILNKVNHKWILSYDGVPEIINLYCHKKYFLYDLQYSAAKCFKGEEIFVFCDELIIPESSSVKCVNNALRNHLLANVIDVS